MSENREYRLVMSPEEKLQLEVLLKSGICEVAKNNPQLLDSVFCKAVLHIIDQLEDQT
jgi:hypothetical protein